MKHEILHVILKHHARVVAGATGKVEITELDNTAMDLSVNSMLGDDMGLGGCLPGKPPFEKLPPGKSYEWYYRELHNQGKGKGKGAGQFGNVGQKGDAQGPDGPLTWEAHKLKMAADKVTEAQVNAVLGQAMKETKAKGDMPAELEEILNEVLKARYNWKAELRRWAGDYYVTGQKLSRKRMNRRLPIFGLVPGSVNEYCAKLVVALDTSGSMPTRALQMLLGEVKSMGIPIIFVQCDAEIHEAKVISPYRKFDTKMKGRGGTDFRPVFEYAKKVNANGVIYLTDLMGTFPEKCTLRTLWVCTEKDVTAPFGKTIYLPVEESDAGDES
jgi:predicted metal-dependent peptidase